MTHLTKKILVEVLATLLNRSGIAVVLAETDLLPFKNDWWK